ncbi:MAG: DUF1641 domain-containing protein [Planctomycetes bacterium]|nr:DUF1641 domain-containing protein [Planctomycetota bacterium]
MNDPTRPGAPDGEAILAALQRIEARLERLERAAEPARELSDAVPATLATAVDALDERVNALAARGIDVDDRVRRSLALVEQLTDPGTLATLEQALEVAKTLPNHVAATMDIVDGLVARMAAAGVDVDERLNVLVRVAERLTAPEALEVVGEMLSHADMLGRLLESGVFGPGAVNVVGRAANALSCMDIDSVEPVGAFGALKALSDPNVKKALGALVAFGQCFGRSAHRATRS